MGWTWATTIFLVPNIIQIGSAVGGRD